jgi:hypothetical protein
LRVLRVVKLFPQPQETLVSKYFGWMPSFMVETWGANVEVFLMGSFFGDVQNRDL